MVVNKRRFIRIEEIEQKTPLTKGDILELIDNGELSFSAKVKTDRMGAIRLQNNTRYVYGVFCYEGMIGLTNKASKWFAEKEKAYDVNLVLIKQPENILDWETVEECFGEVEHDNTPYTHTKESKPENMIWAFSKLSVGKSGLQMMSNMAVMLSKAAGTYGKNPQDANVKEDQKDYFRSDKLRVTPEALRIDLEDLSRFIDDENKLQLQLPVEGVQVNVETHPIKQIIERVLVQNSGNNSREIWNLVRKDIESDLKQFDIDNVIFEITQDDLSYFGRE
ncbi:hypothetical protein R3X26_17205, partial [Vibrio sp. TH_r3]|uniref:hypothetical protein n=1 Tax=Vibrio sp. TH_r3 TaxID=3082084 RepID=UPI002954E0B6